MPSEHLGTRAWLAGLQRATEELSRQPPDDRTVTVSLPLYPPDREHFKLCRACHWPPKRCTCGTT